MQTLLAQITNPAVPALAAMGGSGNSGEVGANILGRYIAVLIVTSISLGGLAVLLYMVLAAISWITAGGDSGKIDKAKTRITQSVVGMAILFSVTAIVTFLGPVFGIDILRLNFVNQIMSGASSSGSALQRAFTGSGAGGPSRTGSGAGGPVQTNTGGPTNPGIRLNGGN
jgi:ABC-type dipeptide/oligopeptide/nickel transport system permease subunit